MNMFFYEIYMTTTILFIMSFIFYLLNKKEKWDNFTSMIFECGYSSFKFFRYSFSSHYFIITMIFLFLDLEFCFILPLLYKVELNNNSFLILILVMLMVLISLIMETKNNSLNWKM